MLHIVVVISTIFPLNKVVLMDKNSIFQNLTVFDLVRDYVIDFGEYALFFNPVFIYSCESLLIFERSPFSFSLDSTVHHFLVIFFFNLSLTSFFCKMGVDSDISLNFLLNSSSICFLFVGECV